MRRTGIDENIRYYFADNEPIWFIGDSLSEKKEVEDSLNRETVKIDNVNDLLVQAENSLIQGTPHASLIIMYRIPLEMKESLSAVVKALNIMPHVKVYEIGRDPLFDFGQTVPNIYKLKELSFDKTRHKNIKLYTDPTDKQAEIMRSLELDLEKTRLKEKELKESIDKITIEKEHLEEKVKELSFDIDEKYIFKINGLEQQIEDLNEKLDTLTIDYDTERNKSNSLIKEVHQAREETAQLTWSQESLKKQINDRESKMDNLKKDIINLKDEIRTLEISNNKLAASSVEEEAFINLMNDQDNLKTTIAMKDNDIRELNIKIKDLEFEKKDLMFSLDALRNSSNDIQSSGRTYTLDNGKLDSTPLIYIKVAEELPFLKQYADTLFNFFKADRKEKGLLLVLRNDDGLDSLMFEGLEYINSLTEVHDKNDKYRMFPSGTMFNGLNNYIEQKFDFIFVVDYIKSNKYYLESNYKDFYMTSVTHSKKIKELGLKGKPISFDSESIVEIKYDTAIANSSFQELRKKMIYNHVGNWYKKIELT